jgi:CDGSH-type Zn-finger protein
LADVEIKVRENGPYKVSGNVRVIDVDGKEFELPGEVFVLCRCGHSKNKPFCDTSHREAGFKAESKAK